MTLQNLRYVIEVANCKSFSRAAQGLFMTQSALSAAIKDVETELGIRIFRRTNRGVALTPDGEDCLKHCKEIVERADFLSIRYQNRAPAGTQFSVSSQRLPFAARAFDALLADLPDAYDVAIRETETARVLHDVSTERSEIGVAALSEGQLALLGRALYIHDLTFTEIARLPTYAFLRRQHPLADRERVSLADLGNYPFVTYDQDQAPSYFTEESQSPSPPARSIHVCDRATKMSVIRSTDAYSIGVDLPNFNRDAAFRNTRSELVALPLSDQAEPMLAGYFLKNGREPSPACLRYIELLRAHAEALRAPTRG